MLELSRETIQKREGDGEGKNTRKRKRREENCLMPCKAGLCKICRMDRDVGMKAPMSEDNLYKMVIFFHHVGPRN